MKDQDAQSTVSAAVREFMKLESAGGILLPASAVLAPHITKELPLSCRYPCMAASDDNRNYYEILHVGRNAPAEIIRSSYRTMMQQLKHHPDLGGDAATAAIINEAFAVLNSPDKRAEYDAKLDIFAKLADGIPEQSAEQEPVAEPARILDPFRECLFCESPHFLGKQIEVDASCRACESPLAIAEGLQADSADQRAVARIDKSQAIIFHTHWPQRHGIAGQMEDVSLTGLRFSTQHSLEEGQRLKITSNALQAIAHVTHCRHERRGWKTLCIAGVSFATLRFARSVGAFVSTR
ncbi:MAG: J domain-containing protein, partial [Woeseiaceae bacterium]